MGSGSHTRREYGDIIMWVHPLKRKMREHRAQYPDMTATEYEDMLMSRFGIDRKSMA